MATEETVYLRVSGTRSRWGKTPLEAIKEMVSRLPEDLRSGGVDSESILRAGGVVAVDHIKRAFLTKSSGGTDEAGDSWLPLSPKTVAYSRRVRRGKGRTKLELAREVRPSQGLTKKQQQRWWDLYRHGLAIFRGDKSHAAARAWFILKGEGAVTLFDKYRNERVPILRDTGELFDSIVPSVERGEIVVRAGARHAAVHHYGAPGRTPQRRLWPEPRRWPSSWWVDIADTMRDALVEIVTKRARDL